MLAAAGLPPSRCGEVESSPAFGALTLALRRAEAHGLDVTAALPRLLTRSSTGADDVAAVLHARVERWTSSAATATGGNLIVGLLPASAGVDDAEVQAALSQRAELIAIRADALVERAQTAAAPWLTSLPPQPPPGPQAQDWSAAMRTIVAYRERWDVTDPVRPLGTTPAATTLQAREHDLASASLARLTALDVPPRRHHERRRGIESSPLGRPTR